MERSLDSRGELLGARFVERFEGASTTTLAVPGDSPAATLNVPTQTWLFTVDGSRISAITGFASPQIFASFRLALTYD